MAQKRLPSFSSIERAVRCRASTVLPQADHVSDQAEGGTVMHTFMERVRNLRAEGKALEEARELALAEAPEEEQDFLAAIPVEDLPTDPKAFAAEVALAFDALTGKARELGRGIGRRYEQAALAQGKPLAPTEFVGTVDIAALHGSDGVFVGDWKRRGRYVKAARDNWQIRAGLAAAAAAWGRSRGLGSIIRIYDDGETYRDRGELSSADLNQARYELTTLAVAILNDRKAFAKGEEIPATTGDHCRYCPSFQFCPSNLALVRRIVTDEPAVRAEIVVNRETAPKIVAFVAQLKALQEEVKDALDTLAAQAAAEGKPLEMGDGTVYAPVAKSRDSIAGGSATRALLEQEFGTEALAKEFDLDVTKSAIKAALRKRLPGGRGVTKAEEEFVEKLRKAGVVKRSVSSSCAITTPKKLQARDAPQSEAA
jgi:hypothetical protein